MIEWYHIWLFTRIDGIKDYISGIEFFLVLASLVVIVGSLVYACETSKHTWGDGANKFYSGKAKWIFVFLAFITPLFNSLIPTQKEFAAIYLVPKIVNNEKVQQIATNVGNGTVNLSQVFLNKTQDWIAEQMKLPEEVDKRHKK